MIKLRDENDDEKAPAREDIAERVGRAPARP